MTQPRLLPSLSTRAETGPLQFGDDWPGVFIRGDNAAYFALALEAATTADPFAQDVIGELRDTLRSCLIMPESPKK